MSDLCACDFANTRKDQTTISRHVKVLVEAGIVKFERKGRNIVYSIKDDEVKAQLIAWGTQEQDYCCDTSKPSTEKIKQIVKKNYSRIATSGASCYCTSESCDSERKNWEFFRNRIFVLAVEILERPKAYEE